MTPRARTTAAALTVAALLTAACAQVRPAHSGLDDEPAASPRAPAASSCPQPPATPHQGAPASLGLNATGAQPPLWSSTIGHVSAALGQIVFTTTGSTAQCVLAVNTATGRPLWNWSAPTHPQVMAVTAAQTSAGQGIVIVATGHDHGTAPAAVIPLVDHLTALDAATGHQLWTLALARQGDGQSVPAAVSGNTVIVTQANGTVQGIDAQTGAPRWKDALPPTCHPSQPGTPVAVILATGSDPTILYLCAPANVLTALNPATGAPRWTWRAPGGWSPSIPAEAASTDGVTAVVATGPRVMSGGPSWTLGPQGSDPARVVAFDNNTGRPLWELDGAGASASVYASDGQICAAPGYGAECLNARTGAASWQWRPAITPSQGAGTPAGIAAIAGDRLYLVAPTPAAARIDSQSTTQRSAPGAFALQVVDIDTGHVIATRPLPAYYAGPNSVVVSADSPPGVAAVTGSIVLISPELGESQVVEAFDMMTG